MVIDSDLTLEESLQGLEIPADIREALVLVDVEYISFDEKLHKGQIVLHRDLADEVRDIFARLKEISFPIQQVVPISAYDWDDLVSMGKHNNSSAFNYRFVYGTNELSNHSYGRALDINPRLNPYITRSGIIIPDGAIYNPSQPGTITSESEIVSLFTERGWEWAGTWIDNKDWQHFQKLS